MENGKEKKKDEEKIQRSPRTRKRVLGLLCIQKGFYIIDRLVHASIARGIINIILYVFLSKLIVVYTIFL